MPARKRLTDADVRWIKRMYRPGGVRSMQTLAKVIGCSVTHVRDIIRGRRRHQVSETE